ncbi:MAG: MFS transporter [Candidatus Lokiarchaeota archaeon]|nr:MFS transporter [Candidatus Lokiarchaeota archaeon]MBD3337831.1 MFS transporter [Candidatus Lokiarchaeota archaeon]
MSDDDYVPTGKKVSWAVGNIGGLAIGQASILLLYTYYFLYLGVPLSPLGISLVLLVYGIWDAINEPLIGHISDFTRSKWGRRKPFIAIGLIPLVICSYLIYTPPVNDPLICTIYLIVVLVLYESFVTCCFTLWFSLFPELSLDQNQRLAISRFKEIFGVLGLIIGLAVAPVIAGSFSDPVAGFSLMGLILGIIAALSLLPTLFFIKERQEYQIKKENRMSFIKSIKISLKNKSFICFIMVQFLLQLSYSVVLSGLPLFFEGILGMGATQYGIQMLLIFCVVIPGLYVWIKIAEKRGTRYALFISMVSFSLTFPLIFLVFNATTMLIVLLIAGFGLGGLMIFPTVLLSDVIDEDQLKTNERREGIFNGVSGVIVKSSNAISWLILGIVLTLFGINRQTMSPSTISPMGELGLRILLGVIPVVIILIGLLFLIIYPLHGEKLDEVQLRVREFNKIKV